MILPCLSTKVLSNIVPVVIPANEDTPSIPNWRSDKFQESWMVTVRREREVI